MSDSKGTEIREQEVESEHETEDIEQGSEEVDETGERGDLSEATGSEAEDEEGGSREQGGRIGNNRQLIIAVTILTGLLVMVLSGLVYGLLVFMVEDTTAGGQIVQIASQTGTLLGVLIAALGIYISRNNISDAYKRQLQTDEEIAMSFVKRACEGVSEEIEWIGRRSEPAEFNGEYFTKDISSYHSHYQKIERYVNGLDSAFIDELTGKERYHLVKHAMLFERAQHLKTEWDNCKYNYIIYTGAETNSFETAFNSLADEVRRVTIKLESPQ